MPRSKNLESTTNTRAQLLNHYALPKDTRAIVLVNLEDSAVTNFLEQAGKSLNITFLPEVKEELRTGIDAFVTDELLPDINSLLASGGIPILPKTLAIQFGFEEFNPMKFEGNAFIFDTVDKFQVLEKVIRYLENIRYPGDKRMLIENIKKTKISPV